MSKMQNTRKQTKKKRLNIKKNLHNNDLKVISYYHVVC